MTIADFPRIYAASRRFTTGVPRTFTVINAKTESEATEKSCVLFLRSKAPLDSLLCLWQLDTTTGDERLVVDPNNVGGLNGNIPAAELARRERARESASGIVGYSVSTDSSQVCFALSGMLAVTTLATGETQLPEVAGAVFDPRFSPDGTKIAYESQGALRVFDLSTNTDSLIAEEPDDDIKWGSAEFVAAEEMGRSRGYWWLPDSTGLLATRVDTSNVESWWISDPAHPSKPATHNRYPAAGTTNATVELWLCPVQGERRQIAWDSPGEFEYLADVVVSGGPADSEPEILILRQPRNQQVISIADLTLSTLSVSERHTITHDVWVELIKGSPTLANGQLLTVEDVVSIDTRALCLDGSPITDAGLQVRAISSVNDSTVTFTASPEPTEVHVFQLDLETNALSQITSEPGVHGVVASGDTLVVSAATPTSAGTLTTVSTRGGKAWPVTSFAEVPPMAADPLFINLGTRELSSAVFLPSNYDGKTSLPVLLDPYGGPHAQRVLKTHNSHLVSRWFAEQGYAVLVTDGRGTPGRGPAFEREVWGDLAKPVLEDQIDALDAAAAHFGFFDLDRVGIRGWSFGGYLAALAVLEAPDRFGAAVAGAPVTKWELYDTHYTERYLGDPNEFPSHYDQCNLILSAEKLGSPLLLIHGLADDNVVAAHTLQFSTALLGAGKAHEVLPLSGVTHMTPQVAVAENLLRLQLEFLNRSLNHQSVTQ